MWKAGMLALALLFAAPQVRVTPRAPVGSVVRYTLSYSALTAAATTQDVTIYSLPARSRLTAIYADKVTPFACASVCTTGTLSMTTGISAGGAEFIVSSDMDAAAAVYGDADAELGTSINRANAIQGAFLNMAAATTVQLRFTSGTGNLGSGTVTNLNAGSVTFTLLVEPI